MIPNGEGWHYLAVKNLSALLGGKTSRNNEDFHCLNCFHLFRTKSKLESHKKYVKIKIFVIPSEDIKILEYNQYQKSDKAPFIIYANLECLLEKTDGYKNNLKNSPTTRVSEHISSGFSMPPIS